MGFLAETQYITPQSIVAVAESAKIRPPLSQQASTPDTYLPQVLFLTDLILLAPEERWKSVLNCFSETFSPWRAKSPKRFAKEFEPL
jgi:hypothetical protein